jgi:hypothetical protein
MNMDLTDVILDWESVVDHARTDIYGAFVFGNPINTIKYCLCWAKMYDSKEIYKTLLNRYVKK